MTEYMGLRLTLSGPDGRAGPATSEISHRCSSNGDQIATGKYRQPTRIFTPVNSSGRADRVRTSPTYLAGSPTYFDYLNGTFFPDANPINSPAVDHEWVHNRDDGTARRQDGLYNAGGAPIRSGAASSASYVGSQSDATLSRTCNRYFSIVLSLARSWAGEFLRQSGLDRAVDYASLLTRFRF